MVRNACYAMASPLRGTGTTTTVLGVARALAERERSVLVVDADFTAPAVGPRLGFGGDGPTLTDALFGDAAPDSLVRPTGRGFDVVPVGDPIADASSVSPARFARVVTALRPAYDVVLIDTGAGAGSGLTRAFGPAEAVVIVTTPWTDVVEEAAALCEGIERTAWPVVGAVLSRVRDAGDADRRAVTDRLGVPMCTVVPAAVANEPSGAPSVRDAHRDVAAWLAEGTDSSSRTGRPSAVDPMRRLAATDGEPFDGLVPPDEFGSVDEYLAATIRAYLR